MNEYASVEDVRITPESLMTANFDLTTRLSGMAMRRLPSGQRFILKGGSDVILRKAR